MIENFALNFERACAAAGIPLKEVFSAKFGALYSTPLRPAQVLEKMTKARAEPNIVTSGRIGKTTLPIFASWRFDSNRLLKMHLTEEGADFMYIRQTLPTKSLPAGLLDQLYAVRTAHCQAASGAELLLGTVRIDHGYYTQIFIGSQCVAAITATKIRRPVRLALGMGEVPYTGIRTHEIINISLSDALSYVIAAF